MRESVFEIISNVPVNAAGSAYEMRLRGDTGEITAPGQFVEAALEGFFLRRPISVCDVRDDVLTLVYKTVGRGTQAMAGLHEGARLDLLTGLGNGYSLDAAGERVCLLGGGVGIPPLYGLAKALIKRGKSVAVSLGFNTASEVFYAQEFRRLTNDTRLFTVDGSLGEKGFATDVLSDEYDFFYACGPLPMLKAAAKKAVCPGQISMEERMGCGFGACMGCTIRTAEGPRRVCKDGPVFQKEAILWDD